MQLCTSLGSVRVHIGDMRLKEITINKDRPYKRLAIYTGLLPCSSSHLHGLEQVHSRNYSFHIGIELNCLSVCFMGCQSILIY